MDIRQKSWDKKKEYFEGVADFFKRPVDRDIIDLIVVLNLLDFTTRCSCAGHKELKGSIMWPFVDVSSSKAESFLKIRQNLIKKEKDKTISKEYFFKNFHKNENALKKELSQIGHNLENLLILFYKSRRFSYDEMIKMEPVVVDIRILSNGCFIQPSRSKIERDKRLRKYQKEFKDFAEFLKKEYFKSK